MRLNILVLTIFLMSQVHCSDDKSSELDSLSYTSDRQPLAFTMLAVAQVSMTGCMAIGCFRYGPIL